MMGPTVSRASATLIASLLLVVVHAGCGKKGVAKRPVVLTAEQTYQKAMEHLAKHELRQARTALERIEYTQESLQTIEPLARLALADATFYQGTDLALIDARNLYLDFVTLYGDHRLAPYAQVQAGYCSLEQVNHPSRDQSQTDAAIADLLEVERRYPSSTFAIAARGLLRRARSNLAESEFLVGRFYLKKKGYLAAAERFRRVIENYPEFVEKDKVLYHLGRSLLLGNNEAEGRIYLDQILKNYPEGRYAGPALKALASSGGPLDADGAGSPD